MCETNKKVKIVPKIPESIILNGLIIKTIFEENLLVDRDVFGEFNQREMDIHIDKSLPTQKSQLTYCHELAEAIESIYELELKEREKQAFALAFYELLMQGKLYTIIEDTDGEIKQ